MALSAHELATSWRIGLTVFQEVNPVTLLLTFCSPKRKLSLCCRTEMDIWGGCLWRQNGQLTQVALFNCSGTDSAPNGTTCLLVKLMEQNYANTSLD